MRKAKGENMNARQSSTEEPREGKGKVRGKTRERNNVCQGEKRGGGGEEESGGRMSRGGDGERVAGEGRREEGA